MGTVEQDYDVVVMDCPPQLGFVTMTALSAATTVLVTGASSDARRDVDVPVPADDVQTAGRRGRCRGVVTCDCWPGPVGPGRARGSALTRTSKRNVFRQLCVARPAYGLTDRDLGVLNAGLSFHPGATLGEDAPLVLFPSNAALAQRAHGIAESTLRRHLAVLVAAGVILRHESPNG